MTIDAIRQRDARDAAYRAALQAKIAPRPGYQHPVIPEPPSVGLTTTKPKSRFVWIACRDCHKRERVKRTQAGEAITYHRAICPSRPMGTPKQPTAAAYRRISVAKIERPRRAFCPTCREEMHRVNDAWKCVTGCSNVAM